MARAFEVAALDRKARHFAQVVRGNRARRCGLDARQLPIDAERLLPVMLAFVYAAQRIQRARTQPRHLAHLLKQPLGPIENACAQIVLGQRQQRLFAVLRRQLLARQKILMDADRALDFAAPAIQRAQREMGLYRLRVGIHQLQEHIERPVRLLGHQIVESRQVVRMQLAQRWRPAFAPAEVTGKNADHQRREYQRPTQQR